MNCFFIKNYRLHRVKREDITEETLELGEIHKNCVVENSLIKPIKFHYTTEVKN